MICDTNKAVERVVRKGITWSIAATLISGSITAMIGLIRLIIVTADIYRLISHFNVLNRVVETGGEHLWYRAISRAFSFINVYLILVWNEKQIKVCKKFHHEASIV